MDSIGNFLPLRSLMVTSTSSSSLSSSSSSSPSSSTSSTSSSILTLRSAPLEGLSTLNRRATVHAYSAHAPAGRGPESPIAKFLIGGGVTIIFELCGGHFMEFLKIAKQTSPDSYFQIAKRVTATKGIAGTLDGFFPWGFMQAVAKGSVFSWGQAHSAQLLHNNHDLTKNQKTIISGGAGGLVQGIVMSPLLLLKTRVMTDPAFRSSGGILATAVASARVGGRIVTTEGPLALMKGVGVFSFKRAADWTTRYLFVVMVEDAMRTTPHEKLSDVQVAIASLLGGSLSAFSTIPLDVLVATFQQAGSAGKKVGVIQTFRDQIAAGGLGGSIKFATRGLGARCAHVSLTTLMMKTITSWVYDILYPHPVATPTPAK